jgi:DDE superfamily endonuclease
MSDKVAVPRNITSVPLPPKCPELNVMENVWQFMRDNWLSNRVFQSYEAIVDHCRDAWNRLADQPWRIMSIPAEAPNTPFTAPASGSSVRFSRPQLSRPAPAGVPAPARAARAWPGAEREHLNLWGLVRLR